MIDAALIRTVELIEAKHVLPTEGDRVRPTIAFLSELGQAIGGNVAGAYQAWVLVHGYLSRVGERERQNAELAYWFNVDPYRLSGSQRMGLLVNLPRVKAQGTLHQGNFDPTDYGCVHDLVLMATGDKEQAMKARGDAIDAYVEAKRGA